MFLTGPSSPLSKWWTSWSRLWRWIRRWMMKRPRPCQTQWMSRWGAGFINTANPRSILIASLLSLKPGRLIELVSNDDNLFTSHCLRLIESSSSGPGTCKRFLMATWTSRVTTPKVVLGSRQGLFLPEGHPLLNTLDCLFATFRVQGRITALLDGPLLYWL